MCDVEEDAQKQEEERLAAAKKRRDQDKQRIKNERKAEEREKNKQVAALAAAAAAEVAAAAALEQARVDAKAAAAAEVESQRLAKIAAKKNKKKKQEDDLDDLGILDLAIAANDNVYVEPTPSPVAVVTRSPAASERTAHLRDAVKARNQLTEKQRRSQKFVKSPDAVTPSAEDATKAAALATAAEIQRNRNIQRERDAYRLRQESANDKTKQQPVRTSPGDMPMIETAPSADAEQMLRNLEQEIISLEAEVVDVSCVALLDRVTELMIKLDQVPVATTEQRACRRSAIARLDALTKGKADITD